MLAGKQVDKGDSVLVESDIFGVQVKEGAVNVLCAHCLRECRSFAETSNCTLDGTKYGAVASDCDASDTENSLYKNTPRAKPCPFGSSCLSKFCSDACIQNSTGHHSLFGWHALCCLGDSFALRSASTEFHRFCLNTSETFWLTATMIAKTMDPASTTTMHTLINAVDFSLSWSAVAARSILDSKVVRYEDFLFVQNQIDDNLCQAWQLLVAFWSHFTDEIVQRTLRDLTLEVFSHLAAVIELHFKPVSLDSFSAEGLTEERVAKLAQSSRLLSSSAKHAIVRDKQIKKRSDSSRELILCRDRSYRLLIFSPRLLGLTHSCSPNTQVEVVYDSGVLKTKLLALQNISEHEQLTISFVGMSSLADTRRHRLVSQFGIWCACARCSWEKKEYHHDLEERALYRLGLQYLEEEQFQESEAVFNFALTKWIGPELLHSLGQAVLGQGKWRSAHEIWHAAHAMFPGHESLAEQVRKDRAYSISLASVQANVEVSNLQPTGVHGIMLSSLPILSPVSCTHWVQIAESAAKRANGWSRRRHRAVPTTDLPIHDIPELIGAWNELMANTICPLLSNAIPGVAVHDIKVHDAFIVNYDANHGQRFLPLHTDEGDWSLTLALNDESEYDGGGTLFDEHQLLIRPNIGELVAFRSSLLHAGAPLLTGTRYIIAAFLYIAQLDLKDARQSV